MSKVFRVNRKAHDEDILRMNYVGLSLGTIAKTLGVHPTTVTLRLQSLNVNPADTRRTFMENVLKPVPDTVTDWLADQLGPTYQIREFVRDLLVKAYNERNLNPGTAYERHLAKYGGVVPQVHPDTQPEEHLDADRGPLRGSAGDGHRTDGDDPGSSGGTARSPSGAEGTGRPDEDGPDGSDLPAGEPSEPAGQSV
ncbi:hypothetical protein Axy13_036 [Achromobacter phage vB_AxyP_19-32_Axy13]|uniref:Uncharacterized protein n=1 Tax=Achromobacter phage vB_AxyP_19-32_Axy13 TaxID=2591044 RepID=A0A514CUN7_9CAUD|nr:hypothetical protein Axy13_036 [Achromobacter phage vB_AxyP_19-32_Axy13]